MGSQRGPGWLRALGPFSPGLTCTRWAGSSHCSCTGYNLSHLPGGIVGEAELHVTLSLRGGHGQTPPSLEGQTQRLGPSGGSGPCSAPGQPWSFLPLGTTRPGWEWGRPSPPGAAGGRRAQRFFHGVLWSGAQIEEVDPGALQPLEGRLQLGPEAVRLQRVSPPRGLALVAISFFAFAGRMGWLMATTC